MNKIKEECKVNSICIRCKVSETINDTGVCDACSNIKCNRTACNSKDAIYEHVFNQNKWYCRACAEMINEANDLYNEPHCFNIL